MSVEFGEKTIGQHGANIFYKEFTIIYESNCKTYRLGSFYFVRKPPNPVTIAEFQLIWKNTYTGKKYASVKLYFNPRDDDVDDDDEDEDDYLHEFGKDEVIEADRQVVIECAVFPFWECSSKLWDKKIGEIAFSDVPWDYVKKYMKEGYLEGCVRTNEDDENVSVRVISYPQYCRFKTCKQMLKTGVSMSFKVFMARGGMMLKNMNTLIVFSRWKFSKSRVDDYSLTRNITVPVFKGRPPKKKHKELMLLKQKKQKLLLQEIEKWKLSLTKGMSKKYKKHRDVIQDGHSSVSSAASRILKKYKKKNEKTDTTKKDDGTTTKCLLSSQQKYRVPKGRKTTDGRLKINKLKKAALLEGTGPRKYNGKTKRMKDGVHVHDGTQLIRPHVVVGNMSQFHKYEGGEMLFEEVVSREEFMKELYEFMKNEKKPILKVPSMGHAQVDFYDLYTLVVKHGGYEQITSQRRWREIYDGLGRHSNDITNAATSVRKIYENTLLLYENKSRKKDASSVDEIKVESIEIKHEANTSCDDTTCQRNQTTNDVQRIENKPIPLENTTTKPCEYKRIISSEKYLNKPVPITYVSCENNIIQKIQNHNMVSPSSSSMASSVQKMSSAEKMSVEKISEKKLSVEKKSSSEKKSSEKKSSGDKISSVDKMSAVEINELTTSQQNNSGTTSFTLQAGEAFKLMIQKRRGRPSKDFRKQIEHLKTMNRTVEVEVFPPIGKRTRLPTWLNELNVDIVNPRRKRKLPARPPPQPTTTTHNYANSKVSARYGSPKVEISPLPIAQIPRVTNVVYEGGHSAPSILKIDTPSSSMSKVQSSNDLPHILPNTSNAYVSMVAIHSQDGSCERSNTCSNDVYRTSTNSVKHLSKPSACKHSKPLFTHQSSPPITVPQSVLTYNKQYIPKHVTTNSNRLHESSNVVPRYTVTSSLPSKHMTSRTRDHPEVETKSPSFHSKLVTPDIRHIYFPSTEKRVHSAHEHDNGKMIQEHPPHEPNKQSNLRFHNYIPPSTVYIPSTAAIYQNITHVCTSHNDVPTPSSRNNHHHPDTTTVVEATPPTVYIIPSERTWVVPSTSV